jgi:hypothetical protein
MKKLLPAALGLMLLAGCGTTSGPMAMATGMGPGNVDAMSVTVVQKNIRGMFTSVFHKLDVNSDGVVTPDEFTGAALPFGTLGAFQALDLNGDGKITLREFMSRANVTPVVTAFRVFAEQAFAKLDVNGDHYLVTEELGNTSLDFTGLGGTTTKKGVTRVDMSQFENALASLANDGKDVSGLLSPPTPPAPAPGPNGPAPGPNGPAPAPGPNAPAPASH